MKDKIEVQVEFDREDWLYLRLTRVDNGDSFRVYWPNNHDVKCELETAGLTIGSGSTTVIGAPAANVTMTEGCFYVLKARSTDTEVIFYQEEDSAILVSFMGNEVKYLIPKDFFWQVLEDEYPNMPEADEMPRELHIRQEFYNELLEKGEES